MVKETLNRHPGGIRAHDLAEICDLSLVTVRKHLDFLTAVREAYEKNYGPRFSIYFPNGKLVHPYSDTILNGTDASYSFQRVDSTFGKFVYVQERKKDNYTHQTRTVGGILIETDCIDEFVERLRETANEWKDTDRNAKRRIGR
jgi:hypothetical protein